MVYIWEGLYLGWFISGRVYIWEGFSLGSLGFFSEAAFFVQTEK